MYKEMSFKINQLTIGHNVLNTITEDVREAKYNSMLSHTIINKIIV